MVKNLKVTNVRLRNDEIRLIDNEFIRISEGRNSSFRSGKTYIAEVDKALALAIGAGLASTIAGIKLWLSKKK